MAANQGKLLERVPHSRAIGMYVVRMGDGHALFRVAWAEHLVGNPASGVLHGGVVTSLLDNASGSAVHSALREKGQPGRSIATLDLRVDYMRPATVGRDVFAAAHCYKLTHNVAFVRGVAYHDETDEPAAHDPRARDPIANDPIATSVATFMLGNPRSVMPAEGRP